MGINPETHRPIKDQKVKEFTVWAEVQNSSNVGFRKESPTFLIAFKTRKEIQSNWLINWRGKWYEITGMDPDYAKRDLTKITAQEVVQNGSDR